MPRCRFRFTPLLLLLACAPALAEPVPPAIRIGVFDPEVVWKATEVGKKYNQDLTEARDRLQTGIDKKQQEIDGTVDKLRQQQQSLSDEKAQQMQKDIQNKRIELSRMNEDATTEMKNQLNDVQGRFQKMLADVLEAYGREKNFALILNKAVVDFSSSSVDITQDLIAKFNELNKVPAAAASKTPPKKPAEKPKGTP